MIHPFNSASKSSRYSNGKRSTYGAIRGYPERNRILRKARAWGAWRRGTRQDGHHPIIFMQCGPVRWRVSDREQAAQRPFNHRVIVRETGFEPPPAMRESAGWTVQQYFDCLVDDPARNELIVEDVLNALRDGRSPVVFTERTAHADALAARLGDHCANVITFKGGQGVKQRCLLKQRLEAIGPAEPRILVATGRYLGEGFDDSRLDTLFLALPVSWRGVLAQYAGRLHRLHDGKREVIVYDYADLRVAMLARMFQRRKRGYHAIGYEIGPQRAADELSKETQRCQDQGGCHRRGINGADILC